MLPTFSPKRPQWRGNTSSEDMNTNFDEILYDLNTIFNEASKMVMSLNNIESRIRNDADAIRAQLNAASGVFSSYEQSAQEDKIFYEDFYFPETVTYPTTLSDADKCRVDTEFGVATLPINSSFSKVYTTDISTGSVIVAPDIVVSVNAVDEVGNLLIEETSPLTAFDGDNDTVWERKVKFSRDSMKNSVSCLMTITLPSMSNPYVNKIHIKPYPEGTTDVQSITYDTSVTQDNVIDFFPVDGENNILSTMYSFDNIQPTKVKVYFRQRFSSIEDNYKTFVYGAREVGIEKVEYLTTGKIGFKFSVPTYEPGLLNTITSFSTDPEYDNITYKASIYASEADFNSDLAIWTSSSPQITPTNALNISGYGTESVWLTVQLVSPAGDTKTPILRNVSMTYTTSGG
jgi:hypothetical protein